jgi:hypothetical protein
MSQRDWIDLALIGGSLLNLLSLVWLLGQKRYWKRIARLHENARIDAQIHAADLQHSNEALRRALGGDRAA